VSNGSSINIGANNVDLVNAGSTADIGIRALDAGLDINSGVKNNAGGDINVSATGLISLDNSDISNTLRVGSQGTTGDIKIQTNRLTLTNGSAISTLLSGAGSAGDVDIQAKGDIAISSSTPITDNSPISSINSVTRGTGDSGKITISTEGKLSLSGGAISSAIGETAIGNGQNITISARQLELSNGSNIFSDNVGGRGNAGNIDIKTTGDIRLDGGSSNSARIGSGTEGQGNSGAISIDTQGQLILTNGARISNVVFTAGVGEGQGIKISARELDLNNGSIISASTGGTGSGGNIDIATTGGISISGSTPSSTAPATIDSPLSSITAQTSGRGNSGKVTITTAGKLSLSNRANISNGVITPPNGTQKARGSSRGINISAREIDLINEGSISSDNFDGEGNAGNIDIKATGNIRLDGGSSNFARISSETLGQGDSGTISIDTQGQLILTNRASIASGVGSNGIGNARDIKITARELELSNRSFISSSTFGRGNSANIGIKTTGDVIISGSNSSSNAPIVSTSPISSIATLSTSPTGRTGFISIDAGGKIALSNRVLISTQSSNGTGGDVFIKAGEYLLLKNVSNIITNSDSRSVSGNGGNISIDSPLIIATPSGDNDISANANGGNGGRIDITSQGLFGIGYRPNGVNSPLTNDITASSTFGQSGTVNVNTPDIDPGKDTAELPEAPQDRSNQIDRACSPTQAQNKFYITGRGGKAPTGDETLNNDEVWLDDRNSSPTAIAPVQPVAKQYQPAQGWVFGADGKVRLIAADAPPVNTLPACPPLSPPSNIRSAPTIDF
jgi:large exoprotein involved in heme utilization and adhesion